MIETLKGEPEMNSGPAKPVQYSRLNILIIVLLGLMLAVLAAYLNAQGEWVIALAVVILIPLSVYLSNNPFAGVVLWLVVMPFVSVMPRSDLAYWAVYRILPLALLGLAVLSRTLKLKSHPPARLGPAELAMGILALVIPAFIIIFQADPNWALIRFGDRMIMPFCMYGLVLLTAPRTKEFIQLVWAAIFIALSQSLIGLLSWIAPQVLPQTWHYLNGARTTGSVKDPDLYAVLLTFSAILLIHAAVNQKSWVIRLMLFLVAGLSAIFAFLSLERAAWVGGILVTIGLLFLHPKTMFRLLIVSAIVMGVLGTGLLSTHVALSVERFSEANPVYDRLVIFDAMFQMIQEKPVWGWGYETLDQNIQSFYRRVGEATIVNRMLTSHNTYLTILTELGLVGFLLYIFPVIWWFVLSVRVWQRIPKEGFWSRSLLGSLWLMVLFNFTVSNFMDMRWFPIGLMFWWLTLGLIANMVYPYLKNRDVHLLDRNGWEENRG